MGAAYRPSSRTAGAGKLPTQTLLTNDDGNNTTYTYGYDGYKRLSSTSEDNPYATFTKTYTYSSQGHINTETHQATDKQSSTMAQASTTRIYEGGILSEVNLSSPNATVWKALAADARGMISDYAQSAMILTSLDYDAYGYPQQKQVDRQDSSPANLLTLGYTFNAARGFPTARSNKYVQLERDIRL